MRKLLLIGACLAALASWSAPSDAQQVPALNGPPMGIGCAYNASPPTLVQPANGPAYGWAQCNSAGELIVGASVNGNVGGYDTGSAPFVSVTAGSSAKSTGMAIGCATGTCAGNLGALFTLPVARTNGGSGLLLQVQWTSVGGSTVGVMVELWDKNPANTTCKDQTNFVSSATDDAHLLTPPFTMTPAAPASTQGDSKTFASYSFVPPLSFKNQDGTASQNIYACVISTGSDTADESAVISLGANAVQD